MIIYVQDEQAYQSWLSLHQQGYVLDGRRQPKLGCFTLHCAVCPTIKSSDSNRMPWTTGGAWKACSLYREELETWVKAENGLALDYCTLCQPNGEFTGDERNAGRLTEIGRDVLDYVFESALIHLERPEGPPYRVTVADIAQGMGKTCGQITPSLKSLVDSGLISLPGITHVEGKVPAGRLVLPTPQALQTLPAFANEKSESLQAQLDTLLVENC